MKNWKSDPELQSSTTVYFAVAVAIDFFHCSAAATGVAAGDKGHSRCRKVRRLNSLGYVSRRASLWNKSIAPLNFAHRKYRLFAKIKISLQLSVSALGRFSSKMQRLCHSSHTQCFGLCTKSSLWFYETQYNIYKAVLTDIEWKYWANMPFL